MGSVRGGQARNEVTASDAASSHWTSSTARQSGPSTGEQSQRTEKGGGDCAVVGLEFRIAEQQCGLERPPLDRRQLGKTRRRRSEKVGSPANENWVSASEGRAERTGNRGRSQHRCRPATGRLADPGLAASTAAPRQLLGSVEKRDDRAELFFSSDEVAFRDRHVRVSCAALSHEYKRNGL